MVITQPMKAVIRITAHISNKIYIYEEELKKAATTMGPYMQKTATNMLEEIIFKALERHL